MAHPLLTAANKKLSEKVLPARPIGSIDLLRLVGLYVIGWDLIRLFLEYV
jgi:hypothetical protein